LGVREEIINKMIIRITFTTSVLQLTVIMCQFFRLQITNVTIQYIKPQHTAILELSRCISGIVSMTYRSVGDLDHT